MRAAAVALVLLVARVAAGQAMPGALSTDHASITTCNDCHADIAKSSDVDKGKCTKCHANATRGFHTTADYVKRACESCHLEHHGAGFDTRGWTSVRGGIDKFDHALTGWPLDGQHVLEKCRDCHTKKDRQGLEIFTDHTGGTCGDCHDKRQPHHVVKRVLRECERCHTTAAWKPYKIVNFSHDDRQFASMPLLGSHAQVACGKCHPNAVFKSSLAQPDNCGNAGCHASPHDGHLFGITRCERCHSPTLRTLKEQRFKHAEETHFDLGAAHDQLRCYACHSVALGTVKPKVACETCHAQKSPHVARFKSFGTPPACATCHPATPTWATIQFAHGTRTKFPLAYKHAEVACDRCHRGGPAKFEVVGGSCMGCHQHANVHDKQWTDKDCLNSGCHLHVGDKRVGGMAATSGDPKTKLAEAHGINGTYPLLKKHANVACAKCHNGRTQKNATSFEHVDTGCSDNGCHQDSLHRGSLDARGLPQSGGAAEGRRGEIDKAGKPVCLGCHTSGTWDAAGFDHEANPFPTGEAGFARVGAHKDVRCESCHPKKQFAGAPRTCAAAPCHADDDAHKGRLGTACEKCHVPTGDNIFNHNTMSAFALDGAHLRVRCADCHPSVTFKPRPVDCFGCHPEPQVHKGQYGTLCAQCHSTRTWRDVKALHDVGDFALKGAHDNIACERCHRDSRPLAGSGNLCLNCHRQDDIHNNSLSPRCGECHTQWSFAPARFDHARVGCTLTGLHRTIACFDCHKSGNFAGLSANCVSCHHDDALRAGTAGQVNHPAQTQCATCHSPNSWEKATGAAFQRDSVCR